VIDFIRGRVSQKHETRLVLDVGGIGFGIDVPQSVVQESPALGQEMTLQTELVVREDALQLVGFASHEQRQLYRSLTSVPGIGPKVAIKVLGSIAPEELAGAIVQGDVARLTRLPGIGKKTAQVLVASLTDAMGKLQISLPAPKPGLPGSLALASPSHDALLALLALGMDEARARQGLVQAVATVGEDAPTATLVTMALRRP